MAAAYGWRGLLVEEEHEVENGFSLGLVA